MRRRAPRPRRRAQVTGVGLCSKLACAVLPTTHVPLEVEGQLPVFVWLFGMRRGRARAAGRG